MSVPLDITIKVAHQQAVEGLRRVEQGYRQTMSSMSAATAGFLGGVLGGGRGSSAAAAGAGRSVSGGLSTFGAATFSYAAARAAATGGVTGALARLGAMARMVPGVGGLLAGATVGTAAYSGVRSSLSGADQLMDLSERLKISTTRLQQFNAAAMDSGTSLDFMVQSVQRLKLAQGDLMLGRKRSIQAARLLGLDPQDASRLGTDDFIGQIAAQLPPGDIDPARMRALSVFFGRNAAELVPALKALREINEEMSGFEVSPGAIQRLAAAQTSMERAWLWVKKYSSEALALALPAIPGANNREGAIRPDWNVLRRAGASAGPQRNRMLDALLAGALSGSFGASIQQDPSSRSGLFFTGGQFRASGDAWRLGVAILDEVKQLGIKLDELTDATQMVGQTLN